MQQRSKDANRNTPVESSFCEAMEFHIPPGGSLTRASFTRVDFFA
jgi:hypothetical protein